MQGKSHSDRESIQAAAIATWVKTKRKGTIVLPTGLGKTYVAITIACGMIKKEMISSCLVVVPTINLISQWKKEIKHWGYSLDGMTFKCLQSAYKQEGEYDLLVVDEVHTALADKYSNVFRLNKHKYCLGLSATVEETDVLKEFCPIVYIQSVKEALDAGAFNNYTVYNLAVPMSRKERAHYNSFDKQFKISRLQLLILKKNYPEYKDLTIFDIAKLNSGSPLKTDIVKYSKLFWSSMQLRKNLCYTAMSKADAAIDLILRNRGKKWIIFTMSIPIAQYISDSLPDCATYHSKQDTLTREAILESYNKGDVKYLVTVKALNAGLNIPDISHAIAVSGNSSEIDSIQRLGRIARVKSTDSVFINLYSDNTIERTWLENRNKKIDNIKWGKYLTFKLPS